MPGLPSSGVDALTAEELALLDFEQQWWRHAGGKDAEIRRRFDLTPIRYYQRLANLSGRPKALAARPAVVRRLQRTRDRRRHSTTYRPGRVSPVGSALVD